MVLWAFAVQSISYWVCRARVMCRAGVRVSVHNPLPHSHCHLLLALFFLTNLFFIYIHLIKKSNEYPNPRYLYRNTDKSLMYPLSPRCLHLNRPQSHCKDDNITEPIISFSSIYRALPTTLFTWWNGKIEGPLAGSVGGTCTSWSWGCQFNPHIRCGDYLKTKKTKNKKNHTMKRMRKSIVKLIDLVDLGFHCVKWL